MANRWWYRYLPGWSGGLLAGVGVLLWGMRYLEWATSGGIGVFLGGLGGLVAGVGVLLWGMRYYFKKGDRN